MYDAITKEYLFSHLFLLAYRLQALGDSYLAEMTAKQWLLLIVIFNMEKKEPSATEIAQVLGVPRQNVRNMLEPLCVKGYVTLTINEQDKRNLSVALTEKTMLFFETIRAKGSFVFTGAL